MIMHRRSALLALAGLVAVAVAAARQWLPPLPVTAQQQQQQLAPYHGITTDSTVIKGLFPLRATGVSTEPMRRATQAFLAALTPEQRTRTMFAADAEEWRRWNNVHAAPREGVSLLELSEAQREAAFAMLRASLSVRGFEKSRNVMRLNGHLADVLNNPQEYGEHRYWFTVMGEPSATEPWGWQLDGHHLAINYFVLGDQVVMTPTFMGSEPVSAATGRFAGAEVMRAEQDKGLAFMRSLDASQQQRARIAAAKERNNALTQAMRDNVVIPYQGVRGNALNAAQRTQLLGVIEEYINNMTAGHARVRMEEVRRHLDDTYFAWIGDTGDEAVFYYRIQSPVLLIEFDHQTPVALRDMPRGVPNRAHVHSVVRTPNGNDYGKDLLREHYARHRNDPAHGHR
jgi:hypothetical protein